eukprot:GILI01044404.1.p1 GENE.GILI01044404.1~~GILI01044404.1.p1  ORF type:complete len:283 (+),score=68.71 GILI01044404.1:58-906(+)
MVRFGMVVMGPAGSGKSTFCHTIHQHCQNVKRKMRMVNLDPAAEHFEYPCDIDIRDLISVQDVMEELKYGPNGGLVYCMEYLQENISWLLEELDNFGDDEYFIFDCPGQIELYTHLPVMKSICETLQGLDIRLCGVYLIDSVFITDSSKLIAGALAALAAMVQLELPHVNVLSKCDLVERKRDLDKFADLDTKDLLLCLNEDAGEKFQRLNQAMTSLLEDFNLVSFVTMNIHDEESIQVCLAHIDNAVQYGEELEPKDPLENEMGEEGEEDGELMGGDDMFS